ncbi:MAG TPA: amino acid permease [Gemmatimonadaceae bacterium]|nr:amino acid permease [Gemmatimonadaceae bacterium]
MSAPEDSFRTHRRIGVSRAEPPSGLTPRGPPGAPPPDEKPPAAPARPRGFVRGITLLGTVAFVVGNMVGTSAYTLPASLAEAVGPLGVVAWGLTAAGYLFVALVYASLGGRYPRTGGPYVFAREAFGDFGGFQVVWSYWLSAVIGNAAILTGVMAYVVGFSRALSSSVVAQFAVAQAVLWGLCAVNVRGVRASSRLQIVAVCLNIIPLLLLAVAALFAFDASNLRPFAPHGWGSLASGAALVVWAYSGVESATVPAEEVRAPERTIRLGTMLGYALGTLVFLASALAVAGALPNAAVASSARPIAMVAERTVGPWAGTVIGLSAIVAGLGTLNGWVLMAGRIPVSASADGLFFKGLARLHPRYGTPHVSLVVSTAINSTMLLLYFNRSLLAAFNFLVLIAVLTTLFPHLYTCAAELMLARREPHRYSEAERRRAHVVAPVAFAFVLYTVYGVGAEVVLWGVLAILAGMPLYVWLRTR